jgi:hypothetical protein
MPPAIDQVERVQLGLEKGPLTFTAALFIVAFFSLLIFHIRSRAKDDREHAKELADLNADRLKMSVEQASVLATLLPVLLELKQYLPAIREFTSAERELVMERRERKRRKQTDPAQVTQVDAGKAAADADE